MVAALATSNTGPKMHQSFTITGSGLALSTAYTLTVQFPSSVAHPQVTTDGAGAFSLTMVAPEPGAITVTARPTAEHTGTTSAAATLSTINVSRADL